jgi:hypothetical protein
MHAYLFDQIQSFGGIKPVIFDQILNNVTLEIKNIFFIFKDIMDGMDLGDLPSNGTLNLRLDSPIPVLYYTRYKLQLAINLIYHS